jgi:hypothetical protein
MAQYPLEQLSLTLKVTTLTGAYQGELLSTPLEGWDSVNIRLTGEGKIDQVILTVEGYGNIDEIFMTAPNQSDTRQVLRDQVIFQGVISRHPNALHGPQWMFTPPPLVFPVRLKDHWFGIGLGAQPGLNQYSGWTYRPHENGSGFDLEVGYDGYFSTRGDLCQVFFGTVGYESPFEVIEAYSDLLRAEQMSPSPQRSPASWWQEPFLCTWGDQIALAGRWLAGQNRDSRENHVSIYETQANQGRWLKHLLDRGIPVGVVSTSDKWQLHRYRLIPDEGKYPDLRGFADWHHREGRHIIAWFGIWNQDGAPTD